MPSDQNIERIYDMLQGMDRKMDSIHHNLSDMASRVAGLETWKGAVQESDNRFWTLTWPAEQSAMRAMEERIRIVERERATVELLDQVVDQIKNCATKEHVQMLTKNLEKVVKDHEQARETHDARLAALEANKSRSNTIFGILGTIGGAVLSILGALLVKFLGEK